MECEVRTVAGLETCYVSLPLPLIQKLGSIRPGGQFLQQVLALQLQYPVTNEVWHVAWSGSASSSRSIEVSQEFAKCVSLPDRIIVVVRALPTVQTASLVTIEPDTEDDWEVMELNAEAAENAILSQVRIIHESMKFPLWLHGHTVVNFLVVSAVPRSAVVQLVPGTEVVVTPKRRRKYDDHCEDSSTDSLDASDCFKKALLRVQDPKERLSQRSKLRGGTIRVELTSVVLIHPQTAADYSFDLLQAVVIQPRLSLKVQPEKHEPDSLGKKLSLFPREVSDKHTNDQKVYPYAVAHILFSNSAAKGHLIISQSLRLALGANVHSWVYVQKCVSSLKEAVPKFSFAPCQFLMRRPQSNGTEVLDNHSKQKNKLQHGMSDRDIDLTGQSAHDEFLSTLSSELQEETKGSASFCADPSEGMRAAIQAWLTAQHHGIKSIAGKEATSLILGPTTWICFESIVDDVGSHGKLEGSSNSCLNSKSWTGDFLSPILYALTASADSLNDQKYRTCKISFDGGCKTSSISNSLMMLLQNLDFDKAISLDIVEERFFSQSFGSSLSALSWMSEAASSVTNRLKLLLSPSSRMWFSVRQLPFPGHTLIYGSPGSGKTLLASAVAKALEEDNELLVHIVFISCSPLASKKFTTICQVLGDHITDALCHAPSLIILDDLDSLVTSNVDSEGAQEYTSVIALAEFITRIVDEYAEKQRTTCGLGPIAFLACSRNVDGIPLSLRASGRFDFHVQLPPPGASERMGILKHEIERRSLQCSDDILLEIATKCEGYDAYDLEILVDRSIHAATGRFLPSHATPEAPVRPSLSRDDFSQALHGFLPVSMRDITKSSTDGGHLGWEDIGGLNDVQNTIKEMIELPSKFPSIFAKCPLRLRSNVLLYGPPGCGKTHIVGAAAAASSLRFISVKGPELLNKYIGASEQAVRDVFSKAAAAAPCLLFFDEFDSIAPKRGHDNTGVTDRVVNQFLTELDGVEVLSGVFVFAATSRPDLLDAALLRPGRLDRLLFCDFPSLGDRLDILKVLARKLKLADDVDLLAIANMTDGFSGADLQALLSDAQLAAVQEFLDSSDRVNLEEVPIIKNDLLKAIASKVCPSVSDSEKRRLYEIYSQFLDSKRSIASQAKDLKGKRATLA